eukprot:675712-Pelagomonas_calceolata.AAC.3
MLTGGSALIRMVSSQPSPKVDVRSSTLISTLMNHRCTLVSLVPLTPPKYPTKIFVPSTPPNAFHRACKLQGCILQACVNPLDSASLFSALTLVSREVWTG